MKVNKYRSHLRWIYAFFCNHNLLSILYRYYIMALNLYYISHQQHQNVYLFSSSVCHLIIIKQTLIGFLHDNNSALSTAHITCNMFSIHIACNMFSIFYVHIYFIFLMLYTRQVRRYKCYIMWRNVAIKKALILGSKY